MNIQTLIKTPSSLQADALQKQLHKGGIIKGKVSRVSDNNRVKIDFGFFKTEIENSGNLKKGEIIQARMSQVGDKILLKFIPSETLLTPPSSIHEHSKGFSKISIVSKLQIFIHQLLEKSEFPPRNTELNKISNLIQLFFYIVHKS